MHCTFYKTMKEGDDCKNYDQQGSV
jgi:hypothetical protein